jgi:hypothetical protein
MALPDNFSRRELTRSRSSFSFAAMRSHEPTGRSSALGAAATVVCVGPHEQESNRNIRYEWNTLFEQGFPGSPVDSSGHEVWVLFTQWHQKDPRGVAPLAREDPMGPEGRLDKGCGTTTRWCRISLTCKLSSRSHPVSWTSQVTPISKLASTGSRWTPCRTVGGLA